MKVCVVSFANCPLSGQATANEKMMELLKERGHEVLWTSAHGPDPEILAQVEVIFCSMTHEAGWRAVNLTPPETPFVMVIGDGSMGGHHAEAFRKPNVVPYAYNGWDAASHGAILGKHVGLWPVATDTEFFTPGGTHEWIGWVAPWSELEGAWTPSGWRFREVARSLAKRGIELHVAWAEEVSGHDNVVWHGVLSKEEIRDFYRSLKWQLAPRRMRGWGQRPMEGIACGTPCIVNPDERIKAHPYVVAKTFREALGTITEATDEQWNELSELGLEYVKFYSWDRVIMEYEDKLFRATLWRP